MGHLVKDQPPPQVLAGQLRGPGPLLDVGLDEVHALARDRLGAKQLGIELAEDPPTQKPEHEADVTIQPRASHLDDQRVGNPARLQDRVDDPAQDREVEVEPPVAVERFEFGELDACRQTADEIQHGFLEVGGHRAVLLLGGGEGCRG